MSEQHQIMFDDEWPLGEMQELEGDVLRVLEWRVKNCPQSQRTGLEITSDELNGSTEYYQVEQLIENKVILFNLNTSEEEKAVVTGTIGQYLRVGDCLNVCFACDCAYDWQLTDREICGYFPRQAADYLDF